MTDKTEQIIAGLRELHAGATPGKWGKGISTHHTVSKRDGMEPYRIAEFHHAADAAFCDYAHANVPTLLDHIASLEAEKAQLMKRLHEAADLADRDRETIAQLSARAVPDGWKLVPELPTLNMLNTAFGICTENGRPVQQMIEAAAGKYAAMLSAAPPPPEREPKCGCETCRPNTLSDMRFIVCPDCGNKRCPKANHHGNACTNSNAPGQPGSSWEHVNPHGIGATND